MEEEKNGAATEPAAAIDAAEVPRRGRGRPRKPQQETVNPPAPKRPRGRPKGSKNKATRTALKEPPKQKRPRGRPRKWPQQAVQHHEQELEEDEDQPHLPSPLGSEPASLEPCVH